MVHKKHPPALAVCSECGSEEGKLHKKDCSSIARFLQFAASDVDPVPEIWHQCQLPDPLTRMVGKARYNCHCGAVWILPLSRWVPATLRVMACGCTEGRPHRNDCTVMMVHCPICMAKFDEEHLWNCASLEVGAATSPSEKDRVVCSECGCMEGDEHAAMCGQGLVVTLPEPLDPAENRTWADCSKCGWRLDTLHHLQVCVSASPADNPADSLPLEVLEHAGTCVKCGFSLASPGHIQACYVTRTADSTHNPAATPQHTPHGEGREILPLVIDDLKARIEYGTKKYGEPLKAFNTRDALMDAYQEALDLVVYLKQVIEERNNPQVPKLPSLELDGDSAKAKTIEQIGDEICGKCGATYNQWGAGCPCVAQP